MQFKTAANANGGPSTFSWTAQDNGGTANGGNDTLSESLSVTVAAVNDQPVRTAGNVNDLTVLENSGTTSLGLAGLAYGPGGGSDEASQTLTYTVTAVPNASLGTIVLADGATTVAANTSYTLAQLQGMQFKTSANANGGPVTFSWTVQDSGGTVNGGADTLSQSLNTTVAAVNDAPVLSGANDFTTISEDQTTNGGDLISTLIAGKVTDVDVGSINGIAITGLNSSTGSWQYSIDNGTSWTNVGVVSSSSAWLLRSSDMPRFVPDGQNGTTASVTFCAWDQTTGTAGSTADTTTNGGTTAFSTATATSNITVTDVNDAPTLTGANDLTAINEDDIGNPGTLVSTIIAGQIGDADVPATSEIAITAVDNTHGNWQFTTNGGVTWSNLGSPSGNSARLLSADTSTSIRFVPNANWNGTVTAGISFRAWDQTSGTPGGAADTSNNGGNTAFSSTMASTSITVNPVNDAPVNNIPAAQSTNQDTPLTFSNSHGNALSVSDVDAGNGTMQVTLSVANGVLNLNGTSGLTFTAGANGSATMTVTGTIANINAALDGLTYTPATNYTGADTLTITTSDQGNTGSGGALSDSDTVAGTATSINATLNGLVYQPTTIYGSILLQLSDQGNSVVQVAIPIAQVPLLIDNQLVVTNTPITAIAAQSVTVIQNEHKVVESLVVQAGGSSVVNSPVAPDLSSGFIPMFRPGDMIIAKFELLPPALTDSRQIVLNTTNVGEMASRIRQLTSVEGNRRTIQRIGRSVMDHSISIILTSISRMMCSPTTSTLAGRARTHRLPAKWK